VVLSQAWTAQSQPSLVDLLQRLGPGKFLDWPRTRCCCCNCNKAQSGFGQHTIMLLQVLLDSASTALDLETQQHSICLFQSVCTCYKFPCLSTSSVSGLSFVVLDRSRNSHSCMCRSWQCPTTMHSCAVCSGQGAAAACKQPTSLAGGMDRSVNATSCSACSTHTSARFYKVTHDIYHHRHKG